MSVSFAITGAFDFARSRGMLTMPSPIGVTELFLPPKTFIKFSGNSASGMALPHGKSWVEVDAAEMPGGAADSFGPFGAGTNPGDLLAALTAIAGSVRKLGTGTVRGVPVTEYHVGIDPAKAAAKVPSAERASLRQAFQSLGKGTIPVDVWVDGQNLVRQFQLSSHIPGSAGAMGMSGSPQLTATIDFYDFGVPVRVSAPPAAQVAGMSELMDGGSIAAGSGSFPVPTAFATPPAVSGSLTPAQATAAGPVVAAFWAALGRNDPAAVARTVLPAQRSCLTSNLRGAPTFAVRGFLVVSVKPAGNDRATVRFTVDAKASLGGQEVPISPPGSGTQWFVAAERAGHWYVDISTSSADAFISGGPCA